MTIETLVEKNRVERLQAALPKWTTRAVTLTADAIVLTLAAPFFAVWWCVRALQRLMRKH